MKIKEYLMFFTRGMPISTHLPRSALSGIVTIAERRTPCSYSKLGM